MIPIRLELENFLSYGKRQVVEFAGYPLICLSGRNGHGKSALLDAITWAIWGQARKVSGASKPDDNLMRIGQTFMTVLLEFEFNGCKYRIKREYAKTFAKPYASLDFGIYDASTNTVRALTDKTIRATQEKIEQTIGLDYDTFINSAFLRQGGSNEFSKKSAKERKQILSAILGLNQFESLKRKALDKAKELGTEKKYVLEHSEKVKAQLEGTTALTAELKGITEQLAIINATYTQQESQHKIVAQEKARLAAKLEQREQLLKQSAHLTETKKQEESACLALFNEWRTVHRSQLATNNKELLETRKKEATAILEAHQKAYEQQLGFKEQTLHLKEQIHLLVSQLKVEHAAACQEQTLNAAHQELLIKDSTTKLGALAVTHDQTTKAIAQTLKQITQMKVDAQRLGVSVEQHEKQRPQFEKRKHYYHAWVAQAQQLIKEQADLMQKKQISLEQDDPSCPLCEQNLSAARKRFIHTKLMHREQFIAHRLKRLKTIITPLKNILVAQHAFLEEVQKQRQEQELQRVHLNHLQKEHETLLQLLRDTEKNQITLTKEISAINSALSKSISLLKELETTHAHMLNAHEGHKKLIDELTKVETQAIALKYDATQHQEAKKAVADIDVQLFAFAQLAQAIDQQAERKHEVLNLIANVRVLKKQCVEVNLTLKSLNNLDEQQQKLALREKELQSAAMSLQKEKESLSRDQGRLEHELKQHEQLAKQLIEEQKRIGSLDTGSFEYSAIATALGKDGIQALLIEETIPEIEHEANALLAQLTDNQAHIMIESLRDLKKGGTKETLDINISDAQGIRPYEMFSGGEAFRIDFALRIAISKLLARRAGTSLQTLIIDEGFGSQDEDGLQRLMEAMHAIQDNFSKVIIVSHLPSMKEQFPVHFVVDKGPQGSVVSIVEQG